MSAAIVLRDCTAWVAKRAGAFLDESCADFVVIDIAIAIDGVADVPPSSLAPVETAVMLLPILAGENIIRITHTVRYWSDVEWSKEITIDFATR
jgi:hypothetical protein